MLKIAKTGKKELGTVSSAQPNRFRVVYSRKFRRGTLPKRPVAGSSIN